MFNYLDYDNDRIQARERFIREIHKKTTLEDIGKMLDKFIIDEKGEMFGSWDLTRDEKLTNPTKDTNSAELTWSGKFLNSFMTIKPSNLSITLTRCRTY